jgi:eukaryotic-like serine/threonine-protein kinase
MEYKKRMFSRSLAGQQLGNYRLLSLLGRGDFADVYLGEHIHLKKQASIKILDMRLTNDDMGDFLSEAQMIARLRHPNIIQVLEFGVENNTPYLVMDYAPFGTLRQRFKAGEQLAPATILPYVKQVAAALHYAHNAKIIHRDIKPENMLLGPSHELLLSDFGIAVVAHSSRTQSMRGVAGTVTYMAPEQLLGKPTFASDQYSLGVVVYEWLSGSSPFHGTFVEIATQHTQLSPPPLGEQVPGIPSRLAAVVMQAIAKQPEQRFASVQDMALAFEEACTPAEAGVQEPGLFSTTSTTPLAALALTQEISVLPLQEATITTYRGHAATVNAVAWSPRESYETSRPFVSRIASAGEDATVQIWDAQSGRKVANTYRGHSGGVSAVAWSPDGKRLASAGVDSTVQVWEVSNLRRACTYRGHGEKVTAVAWSPAQSASAQGRGPSIASASVDSSVHVWEAASGRRISLYRGHAHAVLALAWSPDGQHIASTGEDMTVQVWAAGTGNLLHTYRNYSHEVLALAWSPDGQHIAAGGADQAVRVWEAATGVEVFVYRYHQFTVSALAWSPDGTRIASGSYDRTVQVWQAADGHNALSYTGHSNWIHALAWSSDGRSIASASGDRTVQVFLAV